MLKKHMIVHKNASLPSTKVRPIRVASRHQRELMAIIANKENGPEDVNWVDEEDLA